MEKLESNKGVRNQEETFGHHSIRPCHPNVLATQQLLPSRQQQMSS